MKFYSKELYNITKLYEKHELDITKLYNISNDKDDNKFEYLDSYEIEDKYLTIKDIEEVKKKMTLKKQYRYCNYFEEIDDSEKSWNRKYITIKNSERKVNEYVSMFGFEVKYKVKDNMQNILKKIVSIGNLELINKVINELSNLNFEPFFEEFGLYQEDKKIKKDYEQIKRVIIENEFNIGNKFNFMKIAEYYENKNFKDSLGEFPYCSEYTKPQYENRNKRLIILENLEKEFNQYTLVMCGEKLWKYIIKIFRKKIEKENEDRKYNENIEIKEILNKFILEKLSQNIKDRLNKIYEEIDLISQNKISKKTNTELFKIVNKEISEITTEEEKLLKTLVHYLELDKCI